MVAAPFASAFTPVLGPLCPFEIAALVAIAVGLVWWISAAVSAARERDRAEAARREAPDEPWARR